MVRGQYASMFSLLMTSDRPGGSWKRTVKFYPEIILREKLKSWTSTALISFREELEDFLRRIRGKANLPLADGFGGVRAPEIAHAAYQRSEQGQSVHLTRSDPDPSMRRLSTPTRIFLTVCIVYAAHFSPNVVRETYLAITLGERLSVRVDEYLELHPDLFTIESRGAYINNNPGASMLGAVPYAIAHPAIAVLLKLKPELAQPKPSATYDDPRPNRIEFLNEARARGLDVKLGLAALSMHLGLMVPLAGLAAVTVFWFLRGRLRNERQAIWFSLLYAFGTPIFFRSAFLNQNALVTHAVLFAYVSMAGIDVGPRPGAVPPRRLFIAGALMGLALLCDYSAVPLILVFGCWALVDGAQDGGLKGAAGSAGAFTLGAVGPILLLLIYQWTAFGNPWLPPQTYMPSTQLSARGWHGLEPPAPELLWRNLLDPRYGIFAFCPMLIAAFLAPSVQIRRGGPTRGELIVIFSAAAALWLFNSANQFAWLQWNTGVRYMVPAAPLLFLALVPVLLRLPRHWASALVLLTVAISWSVAMARESVPTSLAHIFLRGFELPVLTVLRKTAGAYAPFLELGASPVALFCFLGVVLWLLWRKDP